MGTRILKVYVVCHIWILLCLERSIPLYLRTWYIVITLTAPNAPDFITDFLSLPLSSLLIHLTWKSSISGQEGLNAVFSAQFV